jgi:hypothetical protein
MPVTENYVLRVNRSTSTRSEVPGWSGFTATFSLVRGRSSVLFVGMNGMIAGSQAQVAL